MATFDREEFENVTTELEDGRQLTIHDIMRVFGHDACELFVYMLMDAGDAARAVQGAINRLRGGTLVND